MFSSAVLNLGKVSDRANLPPQVVAAVNSIFGTRASADTEQIEGDERGVVQRGRCVDQRVRTKDVRRLRPVEDSRAIC